ncbi:hypothetical protein T265_00191 [Opisthorchis viverrini]|uniref:C2H2-type domain-containing protein n=1 Tax=Opisthorchis viverrini TaxID=6198 RepID=A0A075AJU4_OPIVI|nr:hypothetical protein T265_00191 [Opisthorchis viverrini]KER33989.1 hypothetical protein T265_00191 [Opisthorchis viverrini]
MDELITLHRLRWLGHVLRMPVDRLPRRALFTQQREGWKRARGGQTMTWQRTDPVTVVFRDGDHETGHISGWIHYQTWPSCALNDAREPKLLPSMHSFLPFPSHNSPVLYLRNNLAAPSSDAHLTTSPPRNTVNETVEPTTTVRQFSTHVTLSMVKAALIPRSGVFDLMQIAVTREENVFCNSKCATYAACTSPCNAQEQVARNLTPWWEIEKYNLPETKRHRNHLKLFISTPKVCVRQYFLIDVSLISRPSEEWFGTAIITYKTGTSDVIRRLLNLANIRVAFQKGKTLRSVLAQLKDPLPVERAGDCVYKINCNECAVCIGQTVRELHTRIDEHKRRIKEPTRNAEECQKLVNGPAMVVHALDTGHRMDLENVEVLRRGLRFTPQRLIAEAVEITNHHSVNRIEGVELVSPQTNHRSCPNVALLQLLNHRRRPKRLEKMPLVVRPGDGKLGSREDHHDFFLVDPMQAPKLRMLLSDLLHREEELA